MEVLNFLRAVYHFLGSAQYVFIEYFLIGFILLFLSFASKFFTALGQRHAAYYESIGSPSYHAVAPGEYWKTTRCMLKMIVGFPKDFPEDEQLRGQMDRYCAALVLFALTAIIVIVLVSLWHLPVPTHHVYHVRPL